MMRCISCLLAVLLSNAAMGTRIRFAAVLVISALYGAQAANWAVIVAGSNGYWNYRHQSDVCHAFKICKDNGMDPDHIITMHYDDIANDESNPYLGKVFNKPTPKGDSGIDVYAGCQKDYVGETVTADNFIAVITGNSTAAKGGKVLNSTADDNVFIYFTDHGGTGIIAFPAGPYLTSIRLNKALKLMFQKKMYNKLVFYMEACESGSMFQGQLPSNMNIYVTTAANAEESSWGCYCPPDDKVDGKEIGSCLGDTYSVNWMEDSDKYGMKQTLQKQYENVRNLTDQSHVMQYGDKSWTSMQIGNFQGDKGLGGVISALAEKQAHRAERSSSPRSQVESRDIKLHTLYYRYLRADKDNFEDAHAKGRALIEEITHRIAADELFLSLARSVVGAKAELLVQKQAPMPLDNFDCFDAVNEALFEHCGGYSDYSLRYSRLVMNLCIAVNHEANAAQMMAGTLESLCRAENV